jgi:hypothetical protein
MISFPNAQVVECCATDGVDLKVPATLDGRRVMLAIAAVESGGADPRAAGANCGPRHEPAYDVNGGFFRESPVQRGLVTTWGSAAAMSYGPWQMMFCNFSQGMSPMEAETSLDRLAVEFVRQFNQFDRRWNFTSLDQIGETWNTGREQPDPDYTTKLEQAYTDTEGIFGV